LPLSQDYSPRSQNGGNKALCKGQLGFLAPQLSRLEQALAITLAGGFRATLLQSIEIHKFLENDSSDWWVVIGKLVEIFR
jgi:hypothetical protein